MGNVICLDTYRQRRLSQLDSAGGSKACWAPSVVDDEFNLSTVDDQSLVDELARRGTLILLDESEFEHDTDS